MLSHPAVQGIKRDLRPVLLEQVLGMRLRGDVDAKGLVLEMVRAAISKGVIPDKSRDRVLSTNYRMPTFDIGTCFGPASAHVGSSIAIATDSEAGSPSLRTQLMELQKKVDELEKKVGDGKGVKAISLHSNLFYLALLLLCASLVSAGVVPWFL